MTNHTDNLPVFLTRADVANLLRITPRQIDRLAASGVLTKQKLSASRSGFERSGVEAHLAKMKGGKSVTPGIPTSMEAGMFGASYSSRMMILKLAAEGVTPVVGEALDWWLRENGFPGLIVMTFEDFIVVMWTKSTGYDSAKITAMIEAVKATAVHAQRA